MFPLSSLMAMAVPELSRSLVQLCLSPAVTACISQEADELITSTVIAMHPLFHILDTVLVLPAGALLVCGSQQYRSIPSWNTCKKKVD